MSRPPQVIITKQQTVIMYSKLWHASKCLFDDANASHDNSSNLFLSSLVMTAFAFEAYLNHVGKKTFKYWDKIERLSPLSKLDILSDELLGVWYNIKDRPHSTIKKLFTFRDTMAHGRSSEIDAKPISRSVKGYHAAYKEELLIDWEQLAATSVFPARAREDVRKILEQLQDARKDDDIEILFFCGMGLNGATLVEGP